MGSEMCIRDREKVALVCHWDGGQPRRFLGLKELPQSIAFSPDGATLACGDSNGEIVLWGAGGDVPKRLVGHRSGVTKLSFHPDGDRLVSASHGSRLIDLQLEFRPADADVRLWDVPSGREVLVMPGIYAATFSPDRKKLALVAREVDIFAAGKIELWDTTPLPGKP